MMNIDYSVETWDSFIEKRNSLESLKFAKGDNSENANLDDKEAGKYIVIDQDKEILCALNCKYFLTHQFKRMLRVLKRTVSMKRFF